MAVFVSDLRECFDRLFARLQADAPVFLSRIGGSDTDAVVDYLRVKDEGPDELLRHVSRYRPRVSRYNGFYDHTSSPEAYVIYCEELLKDYLAAESLLLCNHQLLSIYLPDTLSPEFRQSQFENRGGYTELMGAICRQNVGLVCYPYAFAERIVFEQHTMFRLFSRILRDKKVLVISPFAESILANFGRRHSFFKRGYVYPEFDLRLVNTPITYAGLPVAMYPHESWFATVEHLRAEISVVDFDVALLSCGSYAMPLGVHIEKILQRKAVYLGGVLQLFFGIMGRRYDNPWFVDQINLENFIYPLERERYLRFMSIGDGTAREAFGAYF